MKQIAIVDYGMGNLRSVQKALEYIGFSAFLTDKPDEVSKADGLVLPGVGAFADAMHRLNQCGLTGCIRDFVATDRPFLGICLGMQLLFDASDEGAEVPGLSLLQGRVVALPFTGLKIPHMGWNALAFSAGSPLFKGLDQGCQVYFVHSFHAAPQDSSVISARTQYGVDVTAAVEKKNMFATQFHPEKSGDVGLQILRNFGGLL